MKRYRSVTNTRRSADRSVQRHWWTIVYRCGVERIPHADNNRIAICRFWTTHGGCGSDNVQQRPVHVRGAAPSWRHSDGCHPAQTSPDTRDTGGKQPRFQWCLRSWKLSTPGRTRKVVLLHVWLESQQLALAGRRCMGAFLLVTLCRSFSRCAQVSLYCRHSRGPSSLRLEKMDSARAPIL